jgi:3-methyladenine DNA glycosylase AlkD
MGCNNYLKILQLIYMITVMKIKKELKSLSNKKQANLLKGYFKTGKGEYGEGDIFLGIKVPIQRQVAKKSIDLSVVGVEKLLNSKIHEERLVALLILVLKYERGGEKEKKKIFETYLKNTKYINNWDLVDVTCPKIIGNYLLDKNRDVLYKLVKSKNLWERRMAIIATASFIRSNEFKDTIKIAEILLNDEHDLIHKATGWMLREVGKRDEKELTDFLDKYYSKMARTMLRYSIERLEDKKRKYYLQKK